MQCFSRREQTGDLTNIVHVKLLHRVYHQLLYKPACVAPVTLIRSLRSPAVSAPYVRSQMCLIPWDLLPSCSLFTSHRFARKQTRVDNDLAVITSPRFDQVASSGVGRTMYFVQIVRDEVKRHPISNYPVVLAVLAVLAVLTLPPSTEPSSTAIGSIKEPTRS